MRMKQMAIRVSAAPQPRSCAPTYGWFAFAKICEGSAVVAPLNTFLFVESAAPMQKSSGAVSPAARATASSDAADDPADRRGQHHGHRHAGLGGAEGVAALAQRVRHQPQHLVAGADHDRQHQAAQGEGAGQAGQAEVQHPDREDEQAHDDRGHARHHVAHEPDERREPVPAAVLVEVDRAEDAERHGHDRGQRGDLDRAEHRRPHPARRSRARRSTGSARRSGTDQLMIEAPLAITVTRTNPSGMITSTNESTISQVIMRFLVRRQPAGSRRSTCCGSAVTPAIRHHASAGRCAPRSPGPAR